nr:phosphate ABC transporter substrate-binding protein PstS [Mycobacterium vicinigordonae]
MLTAVVVLLSTACDGNHGAGNTAATAATSARAGCGGKASLKASGSTAQENAITRFTRAFEHDCPGQTVDYTANGSGAGISEFLGGQTDFAGSDSPLSKDEYGAAQRRCGSPVWNLPTVFGPIAIAYHVSGLAALNLDAPAAAKIFTGAITAWNDPVITALNPGVALPPTPIRVVFRSDDSGTSDNFQRYLDTASGDAWGKGAGKQFRGGVGEGALGSEGVAAAASEADGAITYVEWSFAQAHQLNTAKIITSAGPDPVAIGPDSVGATISGAWFIRDGNDLALDSISFYRPNQPASYPIVLATYEVVCSKYPDAQVGAAVKAFLRSAIASGQSGLADHGYAPVPAAFKGRLSAAVNVIA